MKPGFPNFEIPVYYGVLARKRAESRFHRDPLKNSLISLLPLFSRQLPRSVESPRSVSVVPVSLPSPGTRPCSIRALSSSPVRLLSSSATTFSGFHRKICLFSGALAAFMLFLIKKQFERFRKVNLF